MRSKKSIARTALVLLAVLLLSSVFASAATLPDFFERGLRGTNNFLAQGKNNSYMKVIDFVFFALLFVSIYTVGAVYAFKDFKRAERMIAILLGVMTAFLLVLAKISVGILLPYVHWIFYILLFSLFYWILKGVQKKLWRFLLALLLALTAVWLFNAFAEGFTPSGFSFRTGFGFGQLPSGLMSLIYALLFVGLFSFIFWLMGKIGLQNSIAKFLLALLLGLYLAWLLGNLIEGMAFDLGGIRSPVEGGLKNPFAGITKSFSKIKNPFAEIKFPPISSPGFLTTPPAPETAAGELGTVPTPKEWKPKPGSAQRELPGKDKPITMPDGKKLWNENGKWYRDGDEIIIKDGKLYAKGSLWDTQLEESEADSIGLFPDTLRAEPDTSKSNTNIGTTSKGPAGDMLDSPYALVGLALAASLGTALAVPSSRKWIFGKMSGWRGENITPEGETDLMELAPPETDRIQSAINDIDRLNKESSERMQDIEASKSEQDDNMGEISRLVEQEKKQLLKGGEGSEAWFMDPDSGLQKLEKKEQEKIRQFLKSGRRMGDDIRGLRDATQENLAKADDWVELIKTRAAEDPDLKNHSNAAAKAAEALKRVIKGNRKGGMS